MRGYVSGRWKHNYLAGSIFWLKEGTEYEVKLVINDPDGGEATEALSVKTRVYPKLPNLKTAKITEVTPTTRGALKRAVLAAKAGDVILVHAGNYDGNLKILVPITVMAAGDGEVVIEGQNKTDNENVARGIDFKTAGAMIYGLTVKSFPYAIHTSKEADNTSIMRCKITNSHYAIVLKSKENYVADCELIGDNDPAAGSFDGEGIQTYGGYGQVLCHNSFTKFADPISCETPNSDIFGNDIYNTSDDGIETDASGPNLRIFNNRFLTCQHNGISFQPYIGGPVYIVKNQVAGMQENVFKNRYMSAGAIMINNTFLNNTPVSLIMHIYSRNNIFAAWAGPVQYSDKSVLNLGYDLDYDCFLSKMKCSAAEMFEDIEQEKHGILARYEWFFSKDIEIVKPPKLMPIGAMFELKDGSPAIDAGEIIPNISDRFVGKAPDMGAIEKGAPMPLYGPRK
ncbi:MAG: right-handed parallel beta-helix repeat-containing protein [Candidatus Firestonebacteria bacterium]